MHLALDDVRDLRAALDERTDEEWIRAERRSGGHGDRPVPPVRRAHAGDGAPAPAGLGARRGTEAAPRPRAAPDTTAAELPRPTAWALARHGARAPAAGGNSGAIGLIGPNSRSRRLTMPRAGRPVIRLVTVVSSSLTFCNAARCGGEIFDSGQCR